MVYRSEKLNNIKVKRLTTHSDDRGYLFEVLRSDDNQFVKFGQCYVNYTEPGVIKGFHKHMKNEDNFTCLSGRIRLVIIDEYTKEFREFYLGPENLLSVNIPTDMHHGWKALGNAQACILNVSTEPFNSNEPDEVRVSPDYFTWYNWNVVNR